MPTIPNTLDHAREFNDRLYGNLPNTPQERDSKVGQDRLRWLFEELTEIGDALGERDFLAGLTMTFLGKRATEPAPNPTGVSLVSLLGECVDLQFVIGGLVAHYGLGNVFDEAVQRVSRANMAKFLESPEAAQLLAYKYRDQGIEVYTEPCPDKSGRWMVRRASDGKVLKPMDWLPAELTDLVSDHQGFEPKEENLGDFLLTAGLNSSSETVVAMRKLMTQLGLSNYTTHKIRGKRLSMQALAGTIVYLLCNRTHYRIRCVANTTEEEKELQELVIEAMSRIPTEKGGKRLVQSYLHRVLFDGGNSYGRLPLHSGGETLDLLITYHPDNQNGYGQYREAWRSAMAPYGKMLDLQITT